MWINLRLSCPDNTSRGNFCTEIPNQGFGWGCHSPRRRVTFLHYKPCLGTTYAQRAPFPILHTRCLGSGRGCPLPSFTSSLPPLFLGPSWKLQPRDPLLIPVLFPAQNWKWVGFYWPRPGRESCFSNFQLKRPYREKWEEVVRGLSQVHLVNLSHTALRPSGRTCWWEGQMMQVGEAPRA